MEEGIEFIQNITALGLIGLFLWVIKPLIEVLARRLADKMNGINGYSRLEARLNKIEGNHLQEISKRLDHIEQEIAEIRRDLEEVKIRQAKMEVKIAQR